MLQHEPRLPKRSASQKLPRASGAHGGATGARKRILRIEDLEERHLLTTFLVTNTNNAGAGSFRQAILDANNLAGLDTINFSISAGIQTISPLSAFSNITDPVVIDGTTQPGFAGQPIIELNGALAGNGVSGLTITAGNSTVRGLVINRFQDRGIFIGDFLGDPGHNAISGNFIGTDVSGTIALSNPSSSAAGIFIFNSDSNTIGGTLPGEGNVISGNRGAGIHIQFSSQNIVLGNRLGTDTSGIMPLGNGSYGIHVYDGFDVQNHNTIGGTLPGARNIISGNGDSGIYITDYEGVGHNVVQGNYVGTDVTGNVAMPNNGYGIEIVYGKDTVVGGAAVGSGNLVSGNRDGGIRVIASLWDTTIQSNLIGTNASGTGPVPNLGHGVAIEGSRSVTVGGTTQGQSNVIAFNAGAGVAVLDNSYDPAIGNEVRGNSIFSNGSLGIDLGGYGFKYGNDGVTPNDRLDLDHIGPNLWQNHPDVTGVEKNNLGTTIRGLLASAPNTVYLVDFYASDAADIPSGYGEGRLYLGTTSVTTDADGNATFSVTVSQLVAAGTFVTATATDPGNNTSEFSLAVPNAAVLDLTVGILSFTDSGRSNNLLVDVVNIGGVDFVRFVEQAPDGVIVAKGGIIADSPRVARAPLVGLNDIRLKMGEGDDFISLATFTGYPATVTIDGGKGNDALTLVGTNASDTLTCKQAGVAWGSTASSLTSLESLVVDFTGGGQDTLTVSQGFSGTTGVRVIGGDTPGDAVVLAAEGSHSQTAIVDGGRATLSQQQTGLLTSIQESSVNSPKQFVLSPDGLNAYTIGQRANYSLGVINVYARDPISGLLTFQDSLSEDRPYPPPRGWLDYPTAAAISPDGKNVYATGGGPGTFAVLTRDSVTGFLSVSTVLHNGTDGADGLGGAASVAISPDGMSVYVAGGSDNAVAIFRRNSATGALTFTAVIRNGDVQGDRSIGGLNDVRQVVVSPDGATVLTISGENALTVFRRDMASGLLTIASVFREGLGGVSGLSNPRAIAVSPDGRRVYVARGLSAPSDDPVPFALSPDGEDVYVGHIYPVALFDRNPSTGDMNFGGYASKVHRIGSVDSTITISADGQFAYAAIDDNQKYIVYRRDGAQVVDLTYAGLDSVTVTTGSGDDTFLITPSAVTQFNVNAGPHAIGDVLHYNGQGLSPTDDGVQVVAPGVQPVQYTGIEFISIDSGPPDAIAPKADIIDVVPDPRNGAISAATIVFSEPVSGFGLTDLKLTRNGGANLLTAASTLSSVDNVTWVLANISGLTVAAGAYELALTAAGSAITDTASNPLVSDAFDTWTVDLTPPTIDVADVNPDPRSTSVAQLNIVFSEPVVGPDLSDITLTRDGGPNLLTPAQVVVTADYRMWTVMNLAALTSADGAYRFTLHALGSRIEDRAGNTLTTDAFDSWVVDTAPLVTHFAEVLPDPRPSMPELVSINFNKPVTGFDLGDVVFTRDDATIPLGAGQSLTSTDQKSWELRNLSAATATGLVEVQKEIVTPGNPTAVAVSPDGRFVYAAELLQFALVVYSRDAVTGHLSRVQVVKDGVDGVSGIRFTGSIAISADGNNLYTAGDGDDAVTVFRRDAISGRLNFIQVLKDGVDGVDGLFNVAEIALSPDGTSAYAAGYSDNAIAIFRRSPSTGLLSFVEAIKDGNDGVDGLAGATGVAVSMDGASVYVAGFSDNSIVVFRRNEATGALTFLGLVKNGAEGVDGLLGAIAVAVSPDGNFAYATSILSGAALTVFARNQSNGALTFLQVLRNGVDMVDGLSGASTVAADNGFVYVGGSYNLAFGAGKGGALAVFRRDLGTGRLTFVQKVANGFGGVTGLAGVQGIALSGGGLDLYAVGYSDGALVALRRNQITGELTVTEMNRDWSGLNDGLARVTAVAISPNGQYLYTASAFESALAVYRRNDATGKLNFLQVLKNGVAGVDGLSSAKSVTVSQDGNTVYATGTSDLAVFRRDPGSGLLTFVQVLKDGVAGVDGLDDANFVTVSQDGNTVYATGGRDDAVAVFQRDLGTGLLSFLQVLKDGVGGVDGLDHATSVVVSPDGKNAYAAGQFDDALVAFQRDPSTGMLTFLQVFKDGIAGVDGLDWAASVAL